MFRRGARILVRAPRADVGGCGSDRRVQTIDAARAPGTAELVADAFIAVPDLLALVELAITADYKFAMFHAALPALTSCSTRAQPSNCSAGAQSIRSRPALSQAFGYQEGSSRR
jgi:hypothetical protein